MHLRGKLFVFTVFMVGLLGANARTDREITASLLRDYTNDPPNESTEVRLGIYINNFYSIREQSMDYSISMYLRQAWQDKRLKFNEDDAKKIIIPDARMSELWIPDTFMRNEKAASFHSVTVPNRLMKINATGHMWFVSKISATLSCPMKLQKFPFDTQMCPVMFESFSHTMDTMYYSWLDSPVDVDRGVQLPQFTLKDVITYDCSQNYTAGTFPCLEIRFVLRRDVGFYILQIFVPAIILIIVSWFSFWFKVDAISARAGIGLTTLLTILLLSAWSRTQLPKVSYATALDVWNFMCFIFIIAAFLEFVLVQFLSRRGEGKGGKGESSEEESKVSKVDTVSRIAFPCAFLLFIIIYFAVYAS